jgi:type IV secretory pathway VirB6-like protein
VVWKKSCSCFRDQPSFVVLNGIWQTSMEHCFQATLTSPHGAFSLAITKAYAMKSSEQKTAWVESHPEP